MDRIGTSPSVVRDLVPFVGVLAGAIAVLLLATYGYVRLSSGLRGYVNYESLWSKAQKEAVASLWDYSFSGDPDAFDGFRRSLEIPLIGRRAREELGRSEPDLSVVRAAFADGGLPPQDIDDQVLVSTLFSDLEAVREAMGAWERADSLIAELEALGEEIRGIVETDGPAASALFPLFGRLESLDRDLTAVERRFSSTLGALDRSLGRAFFGFLSVLGLLLLVVGGWIVWTLLARIRASEAAVREREERYRLATRATNDVVWDFDIETDRITWNEALSQTFGYALDGNESDLSWWMDKIHPDDREQTVNRVETLLESEGEVFTAEYRFRDADGSYSQVYDRGYVLRDEKNAPVRIIGSMIDLT